MKNPHQLKRGDTVISNSAPHLGKAVVSFVWLTGNVDVRYPDGAILMNFPPADFQAVKEE